MYIIGSIYLAAAGICLAMAIVMAFGIIVFGWCQRADRAGYVAFAAFAAFTLLAACNAAPPPPPSPTALQEDMLTRCQVRPECNMNETISALLLESQAHDN